MWYDDPKDSYTDCTANRIFDSCWEFIFQYFVAPSILIVPIYTAIKVLSNM